MGLSIAFMCISAIVCLFVPAIAAVIIIKKRNARWKAFLIGIAVFAVTQLLIRIPLLNLLQNTAWFQIFTMTQTELYFILLAFSAGLFEEAGRYFGIRLFLKSDLLTWENGIVFGLGHGGIEAFWLAGIPYTSLIAETVAGKNTALLLTTPSAYFLLGGLERILAVLLHIGFSMLVFYAVKQRKTLYLLYAVAAHTLVDAAAVFMAQSGLSAWVLEGILAVFAALAVWLTIKMKSKINESELIKGDE